jgi:hypothetical protein
MPTMQRVAIENGVMRIAKLVVESEAKRIGRLRGIGNRKKQAPVHVVGRLVIASATTPAVFLPKEKAIPLSRSRERVG